MTRSLRIVIQCDGCSDEITGDEDHEGSLLLNINGQGERQVDLCGECLRGSSSCDSVWSLLLIYADAPPLPKSEKAAKSWPCPCPGCDFVSPTTQGLGRHARVTHDKSVKELRAGDCP